MKIALAGLRVDGPCSGKVCVFCFPWFLGPCSYGKSTHWHSFALAVQFVMIRVCMLSFGHAARRPDGEMIKDLPTPPRMWRRRTGGQLKTWATTISSELAQGRRTLGASIRDVVNSISDATCASRGSAFSVRVVKYLNKLPVSVVTAPSVNTFNERLEEVCTEVFPHLSH